MRKWNTHISWKCVIFCKGGSDRKESACNAGDLGLMPGSGRFPGEGHGNPLWYCLENPHWQRSLVGYSPWGHKGSDMTENWHFHFFAFSNMLVNQEFSFQKSFPLLHTISDPEEFLFMCFMPIEMCCIGN